MTSILSGFDAVQQALAAQQFALSVTQRNVANANNEFYTRQDVVFTDVAQTGESAVHIQVFRNRYIDYSISRESQYLGEQQVASDALQQIDAIMNETGGSGLQEALSGFFGSFSALSATPEDRTLRQQVLARATALVSTFQRAYRAVQQVQVSENSAVEGTVDEINAIASRIASLNPKVAAAHASGSPDEFALRDDRRQLLDALSGLMDVAYFETETGSVTVTTRQGGLLVAEDQTYALELCALPDSAFAGIQLGGADITSTIQSGKLGGLLKMRDGQIASYLTALDDLAATLIARVNEQHREGFDLDGEAGGDFFTPFTQTVAGSNTGAALSIEVALSDGRQIAASASGSVGESENAKRLFGIRDEALFALSTQTAVQFYAGLIYQIGSDGSLAEEGVATQKGVLEQLKNQRDAISGVDLNEEAANLIKYQKAYQASARFANVLDLLTDDILQLLGA